MSGGNNNNNTNKTGNNRSQNGKGNMDILKRSIRERLIQLLAVKPYKKPEIYLKLNAEGVREKDRSSINNTLKSVSFMRDNTYHLHRYIWNDVQEDWPFYTEQEKQSLKRLVTFFKIF